MVDAFFCTESTEELKRYNAKERRRILKHSKEMEDFIKKEALEEQEKGLNTTHLFIDRDTGKLAVSNEYKHQGLGKILIQFAAYLGEKIREMSGITFITLDCYSHRVSFYEAVGFVQNQIQPIELPYDSPVSMRLGLDAYLEQIAEENM